MDSLAVPPNELPYDPVIPLVSVYQREMKTYVHKKTRTQMFIVALLVVAKRCTNVKQKINKGGTSVHQNIIHQEKKNEL